MAGLRNDLKFALRAFARSPLFTATAVLSLALGIGANTAIFTLIDQLMLRLLPVKEPERLVMMWTTGPHMGSNRGSRAASYPMYQDFSQKAAAFESVFCRHLTSLSASLDGTTERVIGELVSGNYFQALGVKPAIGRLFTPEQDDRTYKGHPVAVISHDYWVTRFGANPSVLGRKILVNNYPFEIVGVSAAGFNGLDPSRSPQVRIPIQMKPFMTPGWDDLGNRRSQWIQMFARLKPGQTAESAQASTQGLLTQILRDELQKMDASKYYRDLFLKRQLRMVPAANGYSGMREQYSTALVVLMCMVGLVLLIACSNVANLLIARAVARQKEIAVRLAIGASKRQLLRQLLVESSLLSVVGGVLGLAMSVWMIRALLRFLPPDTTTLTLRADPDWRILLFNGLLVVITTLLFGLTPALQAMRVDLWNTLKDVAGAVAAPSGSAALRKGLVVAQVALSFLLLAGSGVFIKSLNNLRSVNTGIRNMDNLVTFQISPSLNGYDVPKIKDFNRRLLDDIRSMPGVKSATHAGVAILHGFESDSSMSVEGYKHQDGEDMQAFMNYLSPDYFKTMSIPVVEGRDFDDRDEGDRFKVAIVNRKFAQHFFKDGSPVGRHVGFGTGPNAKLDIEIIGVVEDSLYEGPREGVRRQVFVPSRQSRFPQGSTYYVRTSVDSASMFGALRAAVAKLDAAMPVYEMKTLEKQLDETLSTERLVAVLSACFGALATLLAAIGLYGVMAFVVARRTKEIGLRMALGAPQRSVLWLVMREVLVLLAVGVLVAVPVAYWLGRYVSAQLFGVQPADVATAALALSMLATVAIGAGFLPARRASAIDPIQALRYE